jgi:hypothetical protein
MQPNSLSTVLRVIVAMASLVAVTAPVFAEDFVYQGKLTDNGQAPTGQYDIVVEYHTTPTGGTRTQTVSFQDVPVTNGIFTLNLPFPALPNARYLDISVRAGSSTGTYTTLAPRTFIAAAPFASKAFNAYWNLEPSGSLIYGDGDDVVLLNRTAALPNEYFGIGTLTTGFAGMYVRTGAVGKPFYGYSAGGDADAFHYFDGSTGLFRLNIAQINVATIDAQGDLDLEGQVVADDFEFTAPKTIAVDVPIVGFRPENTASFIPYTAGGLPQNGAHIGVSGSTELMIAPVQLPDGAEIIEFRAQIRDLDPNRRFDVYLDVLYPSGGTFTIASAFTTAPQTGSLIEIVGTPDNTHVVNNLIGSYRIRVAPNLSGWSGTDSLSIRKFTIIVEKPTAD